MPKLTYWYAACKGDSDCYSVVATTKKAANAERTQRGGDAEFEPVEKRVIEYTSAFDLFDQVTREGGGRGWGDKA